MKHNQAYWARRARLRATWSFILFTPVLLISFNNCTGFQSVPVGVAGISSRGNQSSTGSAGDGSSGGLTSGPGNAAISTGSVPAPIVVPVVTATATTVLAASINPKRVAPGSFLTVVYNWIGVPMDANYKVFVHIVDSLGNTVTQDDNDVYPGTSTWSGPLSYTRAVNIPTTLADGTYRFELGLWYPQRVPLLTAGGAMPENSQDANSADRYEVGSFTVDHTAPLTIPVPQALAEAAGKSLDISNFNLSFSDEFSGPLDVSAWGPGTKWISNKPDGEDFGWVGSPDVFSISNGILDIQLRNHNGQWAGGILSSVDRKGNGFAQKYGYFEMRAKLPGKGATWPAFWLLSQNAQQNQGQNLGKNVPAIEIDILEQYGTYPVMFSTYHYWTSPALGFGMSSYVGDMFNDFHTYGAMIDPNFIVYYFDGVEVSRQVTPPEAKQPMYLLINLANSDTSNTTTPAVSDMFVDYVRVYQRKTPY